MKFILFLSVFFLFSNFVTKYHSTRVGLFPKDLCPNLGRIPKQQIPTWAVYQREALQNHVVVFNSSNQKLIVPIQLITNMEEEAKTQKGRENFSKFYYEVCGTAPPFLRKEQFSKKIYKLENTSLELQKKSQKFSFQEMKGVGKVIGKSKNHLLLEGKVLYHSSSFSNSLFDTGIFVVKNYTKPIPNTNTIIQVNLKHIGDFYDPKLNLRVPVYRSFN